MRSAAMRRKLTFALASAALVLAAPALAHHSFAMFDSEKIVTLEGTVKEFRWVNPHVALFVKIDGSDDPAKLWAVELTSPSNLKRRGWVRSSLKPGDRVLVQVNPLRSGQHGGGFRSVKLLDTGQVLGGSLIAIEKKAG
jgi:hypothetical protein